MAIAGPDTLVVPLHGEDLRTRGEFTIAAGQQLDFSLVWHAAHEGHPPPEEAGVGLARTIAWWRAWSARCTYRGVEQALVERSLLTLKALTYAPSGGIVAAATSLPENIGGVRMPRMSARSATLPSRCQKCGTTRHEAAQRSPQNAPICENPAGRRKGGGLRGEQGFPLQTP